MPAAAARLAASLPEIADDDLRQALARLGPRSNARWNYWSIAICASVAQLRGVGRATARDLGAAGALMPHSDARQSSRICRSPDQEPPLTLTRRQLFSASRGLVLAGSAASRAAPPCGSPADAGRRDPADLAKPGPDGDIVLGSDKAPVTIIEYASMTCPHCAHFSETPFPELQEALHRYRQGALHLARISARRARRSRFHAGALRRQRQIHAGSRDAVRQAARLGGGKADRAARDDRQAIRLHQKTFDAMPGESEGARRHPGGARPRRREARSQFHADFLHQRKEVGRAT